MVPAYQLVVEAKKYIGIREDPMGTNSGYWVRRFQSATGAFRAPWCVSFLQYVSKQVLGYTIADDTAGVFYLVNWARKHGFLRAVPSPGDYIAFLWGAGHIGIVSKVTSEYIETIEGNAANQVLVRRRPVHGNYAFVLVSGTTDHPMPLPKPRPKVVPRFQLVTSENGHVRVIAGWQKWSVLSPKLPKLLVKYKMARLVRKVVANPALHKA